MQKFEAVYAVLKQIPRGKVATYGQVAQLAGLPRHARYVGTLLKNLPQHSSLPWHRVINSRGEISFPLNSESYQRQHTKLREENIVLSPNNKVNLRQYQWQPS